MKPAIKTISWTVYPPEYKPGDGYTNTKTFLLAKKQATLYGIGSEIYRKVERHNKRITSFGGIEYWRTYLGGK